MGKNVFCIFCFRFSLPFTIRTIFFILKKRGRFKFDNQNYFSFRSPQNQAKITDLERQIAELKEERGELYKSQGRNAQRLLELSDTTRKQEDFIKNLQEE